MQQNNHSRAKALLEKFYAGKCTKEELDLLEEWYYALGEEIPDVVTEAEQDYRKQQFITHFRNNNRRQKSLVRPLTRWTAAAACILLIAGVGYWWIGRSFKNTQPVTDKTHRIKNETNHVRKVMLTDSSVVWLNAHASLSWKDDFNESIRNVELTGEGFFDVHKDTKRPFIIRTRDMTVRVLGTAFNIEAYENEPMTRVSLVRGVVQVRSNKDTSLHTILHPGYVATFSGSADSIDVDQTDANAAGSWKEGRFAVKDISIHDAIQRLCQRHGYKVQWVDEKNSQKNITVTFTKDNFEEIIGNLCYMIHKKYKIIDKQVTIY
jgi:transmembrane sensor